MAFFDRYEKIGSLTQTCVRVRDRETGESFLLHGGPVNPETMRFWEQSGYFVSATESHGKSYILTHENPRVLASIGIAPDGGMGSAESHGLAVDNSVESTRMFRPPGGSSAPMAQSMPSAPSPIPDQQDAAGFAKTVRIAVPSWQNNQPAQGSQSSGPRPMPSTSPQTPVSQPMLSQPAPQTTVTGATSYFNPGQGMGSAPAAAQSAPLAPAANKRTTWPGTTAQQKKKTSPAFIAAVVLGALFVVAVAVIVVLLTH